MTKSSRRRPKDAKPFVRYESGAFAMIPDVLIRILHEKDVGTNGMKVMLALAKHTRIDGTFYAVSAANIAKSTGMNTDQVNRGKSELKEKEIIAPIMVKDRFGRKVEDRSRPGHVATFRFTKEIWARIEQEAVDHDGIRNKQDREQYERLFLRPDSRR